MCTFSPNLVRLGTSDVGHSVRRYLITTSDVIIIIVHRLDITVAHSMNTHVKRPTRTKSTSKLLNVQW
eukprot:m.38595 g.38595  ORF g.38595 m.38595 type:complete len:68 (-) comp17961_c0_seq1:103-306(-)